MEYVSFYTRLFLYVQYFLNRVDIFPISHTYFLIEVTFLLPPSTQPLASVSFVSVHWVSERALLQHP